MKNRKAFTLVEVLIVMSVVLILMVAMIPAISAPITNSNQTQAKADITAIAMAVNNVGLKNETFDLNHSMLVSHINAELTVDMRLQASGETIVSTKTDPWGNAYVINKDFPENTNGVITIASFGPDLMRGTEDDITATVTYDTTNNVNRLVVSRP